jgi:serine/threonine protein kinase
MTHGEALLALPPTTVYKSDRRSRVWRIASPALQQDLVLKQWTHWPPRQQAARLLGIHPAQRERAINQRMRDAGLPVAPIVDHGWSRGRAWLATPWLGPSLCRLMQDRALSAPQRRELPRRVAALVARLIESRWFFRDLKTSNILVDGAGKLWLIDVGSARRDPRSRHVTRMLRVLDDTAVRDGATPWQRARFVAELLRQRGDDDTLRDRLRVRST